MKWISLVLIYIVFISCGQKSSVETFSAPQTTDQVGVIASCTTKEKAKEIAQSLGAKFRVINEKRKLIEFIGISKTILKSKIPKAKIISNKIFEKVLIESSTDTNPDYSTRNVPYYGPHKEALRDSKSARYFPHLKQVSAFSDDKFYGEGITIAIIDTGVYYNHPHLSPNIKTNDDEDSNSLTDSDDDNNGFIDDYIGWDFYNGDAYPVDDNGHGTHVAGLAASTYMGIAPKAKILPVKVLSRTGSGDLGTITAGILYAIDMKVDIINLSLGGASSGEITAAIKNLISSVKIANEKNVLVVSAAGNGGSDGLGDCNDSSPVYPANIQEDNMISVASVNKYNELTGYSNFGEHTVHVAAPGGDQITGALYSTAIPECHAECSETDTVYKGMSGTSMATPIVSGLAAIIKSASLHLKPSEIKNIIEKSVEYSEELKGKVKTSGVINIHNALGSL